MSERLAALTAAGVSVWLDDLSRQRLVSGELARLVREVPVSGVTTNPTIFHNAIAGTSTYRGVLAESAVLGLSAAETVRVLTSQDVRAACDVLRPVYEASDGRDGFVSIEVDPSLARDAERTVAEARLLWWLVDRPNVMIKVPATVECLPAVSECLADGISVNVTLIFSLDRYEAVMDAFLAGLERAADAGCEVSRIASVASFFISRVDTEVDRRLDAIGTRQANSLRGHAAIANARLAYERYERVFSEDRWRRLAEAGAQPQRPLWASTGVKDPAYDDTRYVVDLVAPGTVNTMPQTTLDAVADHGVVHGDRVTGAYPEARQLLKQLAELGLQYDDIVDQLEQEGIAKFQDSWRALLADVEAALAAAR